MPNPTLLKLQEEVNKKLWNLLRQCRSAEDDEAEVWAWEIDKLTHSATQEAFEAGRQSAEKEKEEKIRKGLKNWGWDDQAIKKFLSQS